MSDQSPATPIDIPSPAIPIALYESKGVIFELYCGGRSYQAPEPICWQHLKTFAVTREGDLTFHVRVSQARSGNTSE